MDRLLYHRPAQPPLVAGFRWLVAGGSWRVAGGGWLVVWQSPDFTIDRKTRSCRKQV